MKKIAVLFDTKPEHGGEHQYAVLLAECLQKRGEFVAICGNSFWIRWCKEHDVRCIKKRWVDYAEKDMHRWMLYPLMSRIFYWCFSELGNFLRKEKIDLLIIAQHGTAVPPLFCKTLYPAHDLMHRYGRMFPEIAKGEYEYREVLFKNMARFANVILVDSKLGKKQFVDAYANYMHKKLKIYPLPYVAPPHIWEIKEKYIETPERFVFYPAQFWTHKNHLNLIKAVELLKNELSDIKLLLVGSEKNALRRVKQYIGEHNLGEQVIIYGFVSDEELTYLYRHAVAMIMPSYFGPTNIPPLEAMALGCPVAVSNNFAMPEQVGKAGLFFSPDSPQEIADCIYQLWTDEKLRVDMVCEGYKQIKRWNRQKFEDRFIKIVDEK